MSSFLSKHGLSKTDFTLPVDPSLFVLSVTSVLNAKGVLVSTKTPRVIKRLCYLLNYSMNNYLASKHKSGVMQKLQTYVYPAQTGIGKSVSLQVYVAMLQTEASLIVVSRVEEAIRYCENINAQRRAKNYARCYYTVTKDNPHHELLVKNLYHAKYAQCLVITHSLFKKLQFSDPLTMDYFRLFENRQKGLKDRELVVIDEKLAFYDQYKISFKTLDNLNSYFANAQKCSSTLQNYPDATSTINAFTELRQYLDGLAASINVQVKPVKHVDELLFANHFEQKGLDLPASIKDSVALLKGRLDEILQEVRLISSSSNSAYKNKVEEDIDELVKTLEAIVIDLENEEGFCRSFVIHKTNLETCILRVQNFYNDFGNLVVLDATAQINEFYQFADSNLFSSIRLVKAPQIRKYQNLSIYKAVGFNQSRNELYQKGEAHTEANADMYLSYAYNLLSDKDKMLIICHKDFRAYLERKCKDPRIEFTHWGDHVGKNDWSHCNKVMVVGWNNLNENHHIANIYNTGIGTGDLRITQKIDRSVIDQFSESQVADDLIQAVMRSRARVIATQDSDCQQASIYLFYQDNPKSRRILNLFESQFPQVNIVNWTPIGITSPKKKTKAEKDSDLILSLLDGKAQALQNYLWDSAYKDAGLNKSKANRAKSCQYFKDELAKRGFKISQFNGKSLQVEF